ncbi:Cys-tRNA(Pro) deacylase [Macrococcus hajekii]|uniref:Cys-tRNA(Pro)/Cys-tRNA(Cys) deacylase n=1 Tax=Macrococcus hajekii TaxID=198482 RepID=A0A4R6BJN0_9STAP|nr:Cys-tRNA(Pro) deacylase [Macrococcus hajekii]TDM01858.1 Cys-tRNA(Pro) deacylase [Macrococcus hajekii]GGB08051.1 putative Cys-tRNA(Pro)/Cys-tRNA(Cys) deacylase YjdI [Macrococcus hajekii]
MTKKIKTNAIRKLDQLKINYEIIHYNSEDISDGISVAEQIGEDAVTVYKTLVTHAGSDLFVFVIPVSAELDMKKAAQAAGVKKLEMLPLKELQPKTGYIRGGCSPVGMKKKLPTYIDQSADVLEFIIVSAGQRGTQMKLAPDALVTAADAQLKEVIR